MLMDNEMQIAGKKLAIRIALTMWVKYTVNSVDTNGDAWATMTITRMTMKASAPQEISYDSDIDTDTTNPHLQALTVMINTPFSVKVSAVGKLLDLNLDPIHKAICRAEAAAKTVDLKQTTDQLMKSSFIQLSLDPVKTGDIYDVSPDWFLTR